MREFTSMLDKGKVVTGVAPAALTADSVYVSLKNYAKCTVIIAIDNATTVTGTVIDLNQATTVAAGSTKALAFTKMWANIDTAASDTLVETAVTANTFTSSTVNAKNLLYIIEIDATDLDLDNDFDCISVGCASAVNSIGCVLFYLHGSRYEPSIAQSAITD